jgi:glycosyltransferase involved in cell wall biosynthesis
MAVPRITIDARYLQRPAVGISVYLRDFITEVQGGPGQVTLVTSQPDHVRWLAESFPGAAVELLAERRSALWEQVELPRYLRATRPDVYIAGGNRGLPLRSPPGTRLALVVHDLIPLRMPRTYLLGDPFAAPRVLFGTAVSLARADLVIANSRSTAADVVRARPNVRVLVRYPRTPAPPADGRPLPSEWPDQFLLHCGGADPRKNVTRLLEAHRAYRRRGGLLPLVVLGGGFEPLRASEAWDEGVLFTGVVPESEKWRALRRARAVVYPSSWEGFGLPILEALAVGTPVLAGRGGAQPEVGGDAALYVDPDSHEELTTGLRRVTEPAWRTHVQRAGPSRVRTIERARVDAGECLRSLLSSL